MTTKCRFYAISLFIGACHFYLANSFVPSPWNHAAFRAAAAAPNFLFFADAQDSGLDVRISPLPEDEASIEMVSRFFVDSFWLQSPQRLVQSSVKDDAVVSEAVRSALVATQSEDLMAKYGERLGKRQLNSCLLTAVEEGGKGGIMGLVGIEVRLLDRTAKEILSAEKSEKMLKSAVASLGPKQRRQYKDSTVTEIASELLPPEVDAVVCLSNLSVSPNARRKGIAIKLCDEAERVAKEEWGFNQMFLRVETENSAARGLYERKLGYQHQFTSEAAEALRVDADSGCFVDIKADTLILAKAI